MQKEEGVKAIADALGMQILFDLKENMHSMHKGRTHTKAVLAVICMFYMYRLIVSLIINVCIFFEVKEVVR